MYHWWYLGALVSIWKDIGIISMDLQEAVVRAPDMLVKMEEEREEASVTGQIVVYTAIVLVVTTVWTASVPRLEARLEIAAVSPAPGQLVTDGAHEMTVWMVVAATVRVVREPLTEGTGWLAEGAVAAAPVRAPVPLTPTTPGLLAAAAVGTVPPRPVADPPGPASAVPLLAAGGGEGGAWAVTPPVTAGPDGWMAAPVAVVLPWNCPPGPMAEPLGLPGLPAPKAVEVADGVCSAAKDPDATSDG